MQCIAVMWIRWTINEAQLTKLFLVSDEVCNVKACECNENDLLSFANLNKIKKGKHFCVQYLCLGSHKCI